MAAVQGALAGTGSSNAPNEALFDRSAWNYEHLCTVVQLRYPLKAQDALVLHQENLQLEALSRAVICEAHTPQQTKLSSSLCGAQRLCLQLAFLGEQHTQHGTSNHTS